MTSKLQVVDSFPSRQSWRERWVALRDVLGGALLLAAWLALWTVTWAAVAGPLRPADAVRTEAAALAMRP